MEMPARSAWSALLFLHGLVHIVGFVGPLELLPGAPFQTTLFGRPVANTSRSARSLAVLWFTLMLGYLVGSVAAFAQVDWWLPLVVLTTLLSLLMCLAAWPASAVGVAVDSLILAACLWTQHDRLSLALLALLRVLPF